MTNSHIKTPKVLGSTQRLRSRSVAHVIRVDQTNGFDAKGGVMKYTYRILFIASLFIGCTSNDEADEPETGIPFNSAGPISGSAGLNSFTFGAATAAAQIEEPVPESDWYLYTAPAPDGLGIGTDINRGVEGYSRALEDVSLIEELGLDAYRFMSLGEIGATARSNQSRGCCPLSRTIGSLGRQRNQTNGDDSSLLKSKVDRRCDPA